MAYGELQKHSKYHYRLKINEKGYCRIADDNGFINRVNPKETGLPNCELLIGNGIVKYDPIGNMERSSL